MNDSCSELRGQAEKPKPIAAVTVAISTRDRPEALKRCLDSLRAGKVQPSELIVVDQSREDRTCVILDAYEWSVPVIYIRHEGSGLGTSQNIAFAHAQSPIIAVIDDDCIATPSWLAVIQQTLEMPNGFDGVTGRVLPLGPEQPGLYAVSSRTSTIRTEFDRRAMPWDVGSGNNFAVKREWLGRIGGNDERLGPGSPGQGGVDMDLFYRLLRAGARLCYDPDSLVYHERTTKAGRIARRPMYGHGMGAACMVWLQQGDSFALRVFGRWLLLRLERLIDGILRRQWLQVYEEELVLKGTFGGILYGFNLKASESRFDTIQARSTAPRIT